MPETTQRAAIYLSQVLFWIIPIAGTQTIALRTIEGRR
jgi:hypothetical protein